MKHGNGLFFFSLLGHRVMFWLNCFLLACALQLHPLPTVSRQHSLSAMAFGLAVLAPRQTPTVQDCAPSVPGLVVGPSVGAGAGESAPSRACSGEALAPSHGESFCLFARGGTAGDPSDQRVPATGTSGWEH